MAEQTKLEAVAADLRARAEEVLVRAETMRTPDVKATLRGIAAGYEKLAQLLERQAADDK
jgi:hypothetical protein